MSEELNNQLLRAVLEEYASPDPKIVGTIPRNGVNLSYVSHSEITRILIQVDAMWSWEPIEWINGRPAIHIENGMATMWGKMTLLGKTMICVGSARADKADYEKELIGDLLRNGSMRFGIALNLWSKQDFGGGGGGGVSVQTITKSFPGATAVNAPAQPQQASNASVARPAAKQASAGNPVSEKQVFLINKLAKDNQISDVVGYCAGIVGHALSTAKDMNSREASQVIDSLMNPQPIVEMLPEEEPF
jgi:hypothetical protein